MSNVRTWFAGCSLWLLLTATTLAQSHPLTPILPTPSQLSRYQLVRQWWGTALINPDRDKVTFLTLDDTQLYVQTTSGGITCFDAETGRRIWATRVGTPDAPQYPIVISEDLVVVVTGSSIITLGRSTGDQIWELELPGAPGASPTVDEEALYVPMLNGNLMAFDLKSLTDSSNKGLLPQWSYRSIRWKYATSKPLAVSPVVGAPFITFASLSGTMYTVDRRDRGIRCHSLAGVQY